MQKGLDFCFWEDNASTAISMLVIKGTSDPAAEVFIGVCSKALCALSETYRFCS